MEYPLAACALAVCVHARSHSVVICNAFNTVLYTIKYIRNNLISSGAWKNTPLLYTGAFHGAVNAWRKKCLFERVRAHAFVCHELTKLSMLFLPQQTKRLLLVINMKFTTASHLYRKIAGDVEFMPHYSMRLIFELANRGNKNATFINFYRIYLCASICSIVVSLHHFHADSVSRKRTNSADCIKILSVCAVN